LRTYWARGEMNDLRDGLDLLERAVTLTPTSSAHRASRLGNLGVTFREVHLRTGDVEALDRATGVLREAVRTVDSWSGSLPVSEVLTNLWGSNSVGYLREQQLHATRSYSLIKPPSTVSRLIRSWLWSATG
jgi:vacuolar-type H+-ATPase catalytic subunit A/Vma1